MSIFDLIINSKTYEQLKHNSVKKTQLKQTNISSLAILACYLNSHKNKDILIVLPTLDLAEKMRDDIEAIVPNKLAFFPSDELLPFDTKQANPAIISLRLESLLHCIHNENSIVVCDSRSLAKKIISKNQFGKKQLTLKKNDQYIFELLQEELHDFGLERTDSVERIGTFCVRGGIIDVFPWNMDDPVRIEFWGDDIVSIRIFDLVNQRSINEIDLIELYPNSVQDTPSACILDYLQDPILIQYEQDLISDSIERLVIEVYDRIGLKPNLSFKDFYFSLVELREKFFPLTEYVTNITSIKNFETLSFSTQSKHSFSGDIKNFRKILINQKEAGTRTIILCDNQGQKDRLIEMIDEFEIAQPEVIQPSLHNSLFFALDNIDLINEHDIFNRFKRNKQYKKFKRAEALRSLNTLTYNDYVVHIDYGIGRFKGLVPITFNGAEKECLQLEYLGGDKVFVGIDKIQRVQKYASDDAAQPQINKLGGRDWDKLKQKTKNQLEIIAKELVQLYAERMMSEGFAFPADNKWQAELEASFEFDDTIDQIKATEDVKRDMESDKPMDRLICGDVGFGKTEIAIRAAFKAVNGGKQVAILVPTTILAQQHFETFVDRMAQFPIRIDLLSRFRSSAEQKKTIEKLKLGQVDIVVGTHRLTSADVAFKDLGLLIVDEEQRFGVKHKERLKELRKGVDVLTLTATPIPRTLQQSLVGIRGISNIETPPVNRLPIFTEIITWDQDQIYQAITRELDRGGQIFFVHNRVETIEQIKQMVQKIVPKASIKYAHGQMKEDELEKVMHEFKLHSFDILISTMIIENGLDISNCNTILVHHAERLGLAQLYQLRGRVGRSNRQAYCYLITPEANKMTNIAMKRLQALEEYSELGSGVKISMRDMEMRGAGSLLGTQQSGHIDAIGYELYLDLLEETVAELKEKIDGSQFELSRQKKIDTQFDMDVDALFPEDFINNSLDRMTLYSRLVKCLNDSDLADFKLEIIDRYGKIPDVTLNLFTMIEIRNLANDIKISKVDLKKNVLVLTFNDKAIESSEYMSKTIEQFMSKIKFPLNFIQNKGFACKIILKDISNHEKLTVVKQIFTDLKT